MNIQSTHFYFLLYKKKSIFSFCLHFFAEIFLVGTSNSTCCVFVLFRIDVEQSNRLCCFCVLFTVASVLLSSFLFKCFCVFFKRTTWNSRMKDTHIQSDIHTFKLYYLTATKPHTHTHTHILKPTWFFVYILFYVVLVCYLGWCRVYNGLAVFKTSYISKQNRNTLAEKANYFVLYEIICFWSGRLRCHSQHHRCRLNDT